jgi:hypothetical protein
MGVPIVGHLAKIINCIPVKRP